ncbi:AAA family ATPase [Rhizorhabdus sp. FW153]|uniref:AAA family ATPase n=1 Tax=Rhizorhabdus sp. FW153 TaxID=3400216 RepID=UPI003CF847BC
MLLRKFGLENVRSFYDRSELLIDKQISIIIGPNGGGKTNLLDAITITLRKYLLLSMWAAHAPTSEQPDRYEIRQNDMLNSMLLPKHLERTSDHQRIEIDIEISQSDIDNIANIKNTCIELHDLASTKFFNIDIKFAAEWDLSIIQTNQIVSYVIEDSVVTFADNASKLFLEYMRSFEIHSFLREQYGLEGLRFPLIYLPVSRASGSFSSNVHLGGMNMFETKRQVDAIHSRMTPSYIALAVARLADRYLTLLAEDKGDAKGRFRSEPNLVRLTNALKDLGYDWDLKCLNMRTNQYNIELQKHGKSFLVSEASSGEKELLTYLFSIYVLDIKDSLIVIDEPELHLHPTWQKSLLSIFISLAENTGNQFLIATHSPMFINPESIEYVSRVYAKDQRSSIVRFDRDNVVKKKLLFKIVNSQNNEKIFFADRVILVEGLSDRIFLEAIWAEKLKRLATSSNIEIVEVGGKNIFASYKAILDSFQVENFTIADFDYLEQVGDGNVKSLFKVKVNSLKKKVIDNAGSLDGQQLVRDIDQAIKTNSWSHAESTWDYIKSRHNGIVGPLTTNEKRIISNFIDSLASSGTYVLKRGALEDYLGAGFKGKDIDKLITFTSTDGFEADLPSPGLRELNRLAQLALG